MCVTITIHLGTSRVNRRVGIGRPMGRHGGSRHWGSCHINKHFLKLRLGILFRLSFSVRPCSLLFPAAPSAIGFLPAEAGLAPRGRSQLRALLKPLPLPPGKVQLSLPPPPPPSPTDSGGGSAALFVRNGRMSDERSLSASCGGTRSGRGWRWG